MERLSVLVSDKVDKGLWQPVFISNGGLGISHLFFTDDILLFAEAKASQMHLTMQVLSDFANASGMHMNAAKSRALAF